MPMNRTWLVVFMMALSACGGGDGARGGLTGDGSEATETPDAGSPLSDAGDGFDGPEDGADGSLPPETASDAGSLADGAPDLIDQVTEYLTCKPEEIDPIVDCVLVVCPMAPDPIALAGCLLQMCAPMVEAVNPKCRECVSAAVAQDVAGLLTNCLDTDTIVGGG
jgi:hypothetical protein